MRGFLTYVLFVYCLFVILVMSQFSSKTELLVLIVSVPCHYFMVPSTYSSNKRHRDHWTGCSSRNPRRSCHNYSGSVHNKEEKVSLHVFCMLIETLTNYAVLTIDVAFHKSTEIAIPILNKTVWW